VISERPVSLLVVDDEKDSCANLQDILSELGYSVDVAYDGFTALDLIDQKPYDVALLDLKMPGMDGVELYRRIKARRAETVAIMVTAYASSDTAREVRKLGAWQILSKPVDLTRLLNFVEEASAQPLVMVVDDDRDLCDTLWDLFREHNLRVCLAHSADEADRLLNDRQQDVVLLDLKLPGAGGAEVYRMLRQSCPCSKVIIITGYRDEMKREVEQAVQEGADAVCYKPFDVGHLLATVQQLTKRE
jgi:two-component system response regulator HydG